MNSSIKTVNYDIKLLHRIITLYCGVVLIFWIMSGAVTVPIFKEAVYIWIKAADRDHWRTFEKLGHIYFYFICVSCISIGDGCDGKSDDIDIERRRRLHAKKL